MIDDRHDRISDGGWGVALYIREDPSMIFKERHELRNKDIECLVGKFSCLRLNHFLLVLLQTTKINGVMDS